MPFVVVLAAGMASRAMTAGFEWTYPLRVVAALVVLWHYRKTYVALDWRVDWTGPAAGVLVAAIWILLDHSGPMANSAPLAWIIARVAGAVITVPLAEELAFRGFLFRRLISADFETVPFVSFSWLALLASSVAFGLLHGERWIAGSIAGILFALAMNRRGRFANAVVAHAIANAAIAVDVLAFNRWGLW
jgi:exosortase E/protease (VPEID-CTERM system)